MRRVVVTGLGAVTPLGVGSTTVSISYRTYLRESGARRTWKRLLDARSGIISLQTPGVYNHDITQHKCHVAGLVPPREWDEVHAFQFTADEGRRMSRFMKFGFVAAKEALNDANWHPQTAQEQKMTGICLGSGIGSLKTVYDTSIKFEKQGAKKVSPFFVPKMLINLAAGHISTAFGLKGSSNAQTTACTTGAHAIGDAALYINVGKADVMLAGAAESCVHPLCFAGFERTGSLAVSFNNAPAQASRPFDQDRDGFVFGEGASVLVLEELQHALRRGARIYAEMRGYGSSSDAYHPTSPPPDGSGALRAMQQALMLAEESPATVDYINAHATSTRLGDLAEARAIQALMLGPDGKTSSAQINVSSTKGATGHLLGAAGAVEAMFSVMAIDSSYLPPTLNLAHLDKNASLHCNYVPLHKQERLVEVCLSNSIGFGGMNASLCFTRFKG